MDIYQDIEYEIKEDLKSVSKIKIENWRDKALENIEYFKTALKLGLTNEKPYSWRCAWIVHKATEKDKTLIKPFIDQIINNLNNFKHDSQIGGFLKALTYIDDIHEDYLGILADFCIKIIYDSQKPSHNKYYAIQLLIKIAKKFPDLAREFSLIIEENRPYFEKPYLKKYSKEALIKLKG